MIDEAISQSVQEAMRTALDELRNEQEPRLTLSSQDVAYHLGCHISKARELMNDGTLATVTIGQRLRVPRTALESFLEQASTAA